MPICPKCRETSQVLGEKCPRDDYYFVDDDAIAGAFVDPWLGRIIADRYVILGLINEGGMGAVYRALQLPMRRDVAVKVLRGGAQDSMRGQERFAREALAISRLQHPNIITLHDFGFERQLYPYMVMEYAPGQELSAWLRQPDLTVDRLQHITRQILSALAEAHRQNIVHRDLKPSNVIITRAGDDTDFPKLLDFGIARLLNEEFTRHLTRDGEVFGTPHYMAPEQAKGSAGIGPATDVYAMGIMIYEFFSGRQPFVGDTPLSILFKHLHEPLPAFVPRPGLKVPPGMAEFIDRATQKEAEERFADAAAMLIAFDEVFGLAPRVVAPALHKKVSSAQTSLARQSLISAQKTKELFPGQTDTGEATPITEPITEPRPNVSSPTEEMGHQGQSGSRQSKAVRALLIVATMVVILGGGASLVMALLLSGDKTTLEEPRAMQANAEKAKAEIRAEQDRGEEIDPGDESEPAAEESLSAGSPAEEEIDEPDLAAAEEASEVMEASPKPVEPKARKVVVQEPTQAVRRPQREVSRPNPAPPTPVEAPGEAEKPVESASKQGPTEPSPAEPIQAPVPEAPAIMDESPQRAVEPARFDRPTAPPMRFDRPAR